MSHTDYDSDQLKAIETFKDILINQTPETVEAAMPHAIAILGQDTVDEIIDEVGYDLRPDWDDIDVNMGDIAGGF